MQKTMKILTIIMSISLCTVQPLYAKSKKNTTELAAKTIASALVSVACGYMLVKIFLPETVNNGYKIYDYLFFDRRYSKPENLKIIQNLILYGFGTILSTSGLIKFGSISLDNLGKTVS